MPLVQLSASFQSLLPLPIRKLGPSGANSQVVVLCTFQDLLGLSNKLSCEAGSFSHCLNPPTGFFSQQFWGFISPHWNPKLHSLPCSLPPPVVLPSLSACKCGTAPFAFAKPGPPALLWVFTAWPPVSAPSTGLDECFFFNSLVSDFHIVQFFGSSGCCLFLNLLLSFLWLYEEAQCI